MFIYTVFFFSLFCYVGSEDPKACSGEKVDVNCEPRCDPPCHNGYCEAPQLCKCSPGYMKASSGLCEAKCSNSTCINGTCISPGICQCRPGFILTNSSDGSEACLPKCKSGYELIGGVCRPTCHHSCGKGTCISPNVCQCFRGYKIDIKKIVLADSKGDLCIPSCKHCVGECVAPNTCITTTTVTTPPNYTSKQPDPTTVSSSQSTSTTPATSGSTISSVTSEPTSSRLTTMLTIKTSTMTSSVFPTLWTDTTIAADSSTTAVFTSPSTTVVYTDEKQNLTAETNGTKSVKIALTNSPESALRKGEETWIEQHWTSLLLAILLLLFAVALILVAWRLKPCISYLRGRSYYIPGEPVQYSIGTNQ